MCVRVCVCVVVCVCLFDMSRCTVVCLFFRAQPLRRLAPGEEQMQGVCVRVCVCGCVCVCVCVFVWDEWVQVRISADL